MFGAPVPVLAVHLKHNLSSGKLNEMVTTRFQEKHLGIEKKQIGELECLKQTRPNVTLHVILACHRA